MNKKPFIIAIEGHDYAGKTTIATELAKLLNEKGIPALYKKIPDYKSITGTIIKNYLAGNIKPGSQLQMAAIFSLNRVKATRDMIEEANKLRAEVIIMDRCWVSNAATMFRKEDIDPKLGYRQSLKMFTDTIKRIEFEEAGIVKPDSVITLICPNNDMVARRMSMRSTDSIMNNGMPDIHETMDKVAFARSNYVYIAHTQVSPVYSTSEVNANDIGVAIASFVERVNGKISMKLDRSALITYECLNSELCKYDD